MASAATAFPDTGSAFLKNREGHLFPELLTNVRCPVSAKPMCILLSSCCGPGGSQRALPQGLRGQVLAGRAGQGEGIPGRGSACGGGRSGTEGKLPFTVEARGAGVQVNDSCGT